MSLSPERIEEIRAGFFAKFGNVFEYEEAHTDYFLTILNQELERERGEMRKRVDEAWEFMGGNFWSDTMANHWEMGDSFLRPDELEIAEKVMLPIIKDNIYDALALSDKQLKS